MPSAKRLPSSLPLRMVRLHAKLALAILVGIAVTVAIKPLTLGWGTRALAGWDAGVVVYLGPDAVFDVAREHHTHSSPRVGTR